MHKSSGTFSFCFLLFCFFLNKLMTLNGFTLFWPIYILSNFVTLCQAWKPTTAVALWPLAQHDGPYIYTMRGWRTNNSTKHLGSIPSSGYVSHWLVATHYFFFHYMINVYCFNKKLKSPLNSHRVLNASDLASLPVRLWGNSHFSMVFFCFLEITSCLRSWPN